MMREEEEDGRKNDFHVVDLEIENKNLQLNLDLTKEKLDILNNVKLDLDSTVNSLNQDLAEAVKEKNQLCVELAYMRDNVSGFKEEHNRTNEALREVNNKMEELECTIVGKNCKLYEVDQELVRVQSNLEERDKLVAETSVEIGKMEVLNSLLKNEVVMKVESVQKVKSSLDGEISAKEEESRRYCVELEHLKENIEGFKVESRRLTEELKHYASLNSELTKELQEN
jgi:chromosome segregation ATPase